MGTFKAAAKYALCAFLLVALLATILPDPARAFFLKGGTASTVTPPATGFVTQRAPTVTDDSSKGYVVGSKDLWNYNGTFYELTSDAPGAAVWTQVPALSIYPLDEATGAAFAYGTYKLRSGYGGNAVQLRRTSDSTDQAFGFTSTSLSFGTREVVSQSAIATFLSGAGTYNTVYDQSGNGYDLTNELASRLDYYAIVDGEILGISFNGPQQNSRKLSNASAPFTQVQSVSLFLGGRLFFGNNSMAMMELGVPTANRKLSVSISPNSGILFANMAGQTSPQVLEYITNGTATSRTVRQNSKTATITNTLTASSATGVALGNGVGDGGTAGMAVHAYIGYDRTLTASERKRVVMSMMKAENIYPQVIDSIVIHGDSLEQGNSLESGTTATAVWTTQVQSLITKPFRYYNLGRGGVRASGASGLDSEATTVYTNSYTAGAENILIMGGGSNDIAGNVDVATAKAALLSMATKAKAVGYSKVYWKPVIPRTSGLSITGAEFESRRLQLRDEMVATVGTNGLDGVIPLPDSIFLLSNWNASITFDNVHLKGGANQIMAQAIADYINARHYAANDFAPRFAANDNWLMADLRAGFGKRKEAA